MIIKLTGDISQHNEDKETALLVSEGKSNNMETPIANDHGHHSPKLHDVCLKTE